MFPYLLLPLVVLVAGVLIFLTSGNPKVVTVGQVLFLSGFFIFLWFLTFRAPWLPPSPAYHW
jgi:hypothetical protein